MKHGKSLLVAILMLVGVVVFLPSCSKGGSGGEGPTVGAEGSSDEDTTITVGGSSGGGNGDSGDESGYLFQWEKSLDNGVTFSGIAYTCDSSGYTGWTLKASATGNLDHESPISEAGEVSFDFPVPIVDSTMLETSVMFNMTGSMTAGWENPSCTYFTVTDGIFLDITLNIPINSVRIKGGSTYQGVAVCDKYTTPAFAAVASMNMTALLMPRDCSDQ